MEVTALYWRQLYSYLSRQHRRVKRAQRQMALRAVAAEAGFRPLRPYGSAVKRPSSAPN